METSDTHMSQRRHHPPIFLYKTLEISQTLDRYCDGSDVPDVAGGRGAGGRIGGRMWVRSSQRSQPLRLQARALEVPVGGARRNPSS